MTDINQLINDLQEMIDDERFRVNDLFQRIRDAVPRPMTLVFERDAVGVMWCFRSPFTYRYVSAYGKFIGTVSSTDTITKDTEQEMIAAMQSHFNAAWSAMTAKGGAT